MKYNSPVTHEEVSKRAHVIWEQCGYPEGHETEHWLRAEDELRTERGQAERFARSDTGTRAD